MGWGSTLFMQGNGGPNKCLNFFKLPYLIEFVILFMYYSYYNFCYEINTIQMMNICIWQSKMYSISVKALVST